MTRNIKLILMFAPLVLLFILIMGVTLDAKNAKSQRHSCQVVGLGEVASSVRRDDNLLYANSANPQTDIALQCEALGLVVVNDSDLFQTDISAGNAAVVTHHEYRYLPDRWKIEVVTGAGK